MEGRWTPIQVKAQDTRVNIYIYIYIYKGFQIIIYPLCCLRKGSSIYDVHEKIRFSSVHMRPHEADPSPPCGGSHVVDLICALFSQPGLTISHYHLKTIGIFVIQKLLPKQIAYGV